MGVQTMSKHNFLELAASFRADFPALEKWTYMDVAARGVLSSRVRRAIEAHLDDAQNNGATKDQWFATIERARASFAQLINAAPDEVAFIKNVSEGINTIASGFAWERGDNVVICSELEHPNNIYPWLHLRDRGVEIRSVPATGGEIDVQQLLEYADERTRIITVSTITFAPGHSTNVDLLGEECRKRNIFFFVDAAQSVGVSHTDVQQSKIDALSTSTQKGLLALYGIGFLYVNRTKFEEVRPPFLARFSVDLGEAHEAEMGALSYSLHPSARRYEIGNYNYVGAVAVEASINEIMRLKTTRIEEYVCKLSSRLSDGLKRMGFQLSEPSDGKLTHMVCVGSPGGQEDNLLEVHEYLLERKVKASFRRGLLRFSLHAYNNEEDVDTVVNLAEEAVSRL